MILLFSLPLSIGGPNSLFALGRLWAKVGLRLAGVRVQISGRPPERKVELVIFMPNHQSNFDILALLVAISSPFLWLAKKDLFRIPLFGHAMRLAGCIAVDRAEHEKAVLGMDEALQRIRNGESVMIFPEGTRLPHGRLLPFKKGGFMTAIKAQTPIVPISIRGSRSVMPKHSFTVHGSCISLTFFPPVTTSGMTAADRDHLMTTVRERLAGALADEESA